MLVPFLHEGHDQASLQVSYRASADDAVTVAGQRRTCTGLPSLQKTHSAVVTRYLKASTPALWIVYAAHEYLPCADGNSVQYTGTIPDRVSRNAATAHFRSLADDSAGRGQR